MRRCLCNTPGDPLKLKGEDGVISVAHLTDEAALGAKVTAEHVVRGVLHQRAQEVYILALCYLQQETDAL